MVLTKPALNPEMIRSKPDGSVDVESIPLKLSDIDRNALEEANKLKNSIGGKIYAVAVLTWGPIAKRQKDISMTLQEALAKAADEAFIVVDESIVPGDPVTTASAIVAMLKKQNISPDIILAGEATIDGFSGQVAGRVAAKLGLPYISYASKLEIKEGKVIAERQLEDEVVTVEAPLPIVISVTREINQPRPPTLLQIRRAGRKPQHKLAVSDLEGVIPPKKEIEELKVLTIKRKQIIVEGDTLDEIADKLLDSLIKEGVLNL